METSTRARAGTPVELVLAAERLIADHGVEGVSMRRIAAEAGQRNVASVQYHFGSREGLLRAVIEHRLPGVNQRRSELLDALDLAGRGDDARGLVDALARPLFELGPDARYVEFSVRVRASREFLDVFESMGSHGRSARMVIRRLADLAPVPSPVRENRVRLLSTLMLDGIAERWSRRRSGVDDGISDGAFFDDLVDVMVGMVTLPPG